MGGSLFLPPTPIRSHLPVSRASITATTPPHWWNDILGPILPGGSRPAARPRPSSHQRPLGDHSYTAPRYLWIPDLDCSLAPLSRPPRGVTSSPGCPLLAAHAFWDVYADGSWYPVADSAESLLGEAATHIGGCSRIFAPSASALETGLIVLRVDARALSRVDGGSPRMMELVVITSGLILLHSLGRTYRRTTETSLWKSKVTSITTMNSFRSVEAAKERTMLQASKLRSVTFW